LKKSDQGAVLRQNGWAAAFYLSALLCAIAWMGATTSASSSPPRTARMVHGNGEQSTPEQNGNSRSPQNKNNVLSAQPNSPAATYMGAETCSQCHYDKFASYQNSPHSFSGDPKTPAANFGCESCHGPASNHVGGGGGRGVGGLMNFAKTLPTRERNGVCLECHTRGIVALWHGSKHDDAKLACVDCHQIHGGNPKLLAWPTQQQLCTQCHQQIRSALMKPSHHPLREEKMQCTNCHNPHGTQTAKLISANSANDKCYECHAEKRGPFLWEHPPVRENCINCHDPHGSPHEPLCW
jgi:DmsE family decaheme c-type cytochrome